jgi:hypothetical protein
VLAHELLCLLNITLAQRLHDLAMPFYARLSKVVGQERSVL